ncbi:MAG TPA: cytochrome c [Candidatus Baltobacteraceae bacterium]|jgi:mono/diheme cytochrome c family protein|nr:cytochrome c [Candidatus Baltobacteraceae bacterium]
MKLSIQSRGMILGWISSVAALALAVAAGEVFRPAPSPSPSSAGSNSLTNPRAGTLEQKGYALFMLNCAHCHGADARGDEGPDLHDVTKSDARIASLIENGKKGEMPRFATKLTNADVKALVAFIRSLKD